MPTIDELLECYEGIMWLFALDAASGFWVVQTSARAREYTAFICPLGHFEWLRMPQGFKNAPQLYQRMVDNALWGFVKMPPGKHCQVPDGQEVTDVFVYGVPDDDDIIPRFNSRSFIDDIKGAARSVKDCIKLIDIVLTRLRHWCISISLTKSTFCKRSIEYLSHRISANGLECASKKLDIIRDYPFPTSLRGVQSFLGSLNFYGRFVEHFAIIAAPLYGLKDEDFKQPSNNSRLNDAKAAFELLKNRLIHAPILKLPNPSLPYHVVLYATGWAVSATLCQQHDKQLFPIRFVSRVLKQSEMNYHESEREILALLKLLDVCYTLLSGKELVIYTRYSVLDWVYKTKTVSGRALHWAVMLSPWTITVHRYNIHNDGLAKLIASSITPPNEMDKVIEQFNSAKLNGRLNPSQHIINRINADSVCTVISFDGSASAKNRIGSCGIVVWSLPTWTIQYVSGTPLADVTVNQAEYYGCLVALDYAINNGLNDLIITGDSRVVIQQINGLIMCKEPTLKTLLERVQMKINKLEKVSFIHGTREYNVAADFVTTRSMETRMPFTTPSVMDHKLMISRNRVPELICDPETMDYIKDSLTISTEYCDVLDDLINDIAGSVNLFSTESNSSGDGCGAYNDIDCKLMIVKNDPMVIVESMTASNKFAYPVGDLLDDDELLVRYEMVDCYGGYFNQSRLIAVTTARLLIIRLGTFSVLHTHSLDNAFAVKSTDDRTEVVFTGWSLRISAPPVIISWLNDVALTSGKSDRSQKRIKHAIVNISSIVTNDLNSAQDERNKRIVEAQDQEKWIAEIKWFIRGDLDKLTIADSKRMHKMVPHFELDQNGTLFRVERTSNRAELSWLLVVPTKLIRDVLHTYHTSFEGGHQGVSRTYERIRAHYYWKGMFSDIQRFVLACVDCSTGKGRPWVRGLSPGNLLPLYPFHIVSMDFVTELPRSDRGNNTLLLFQDMFSGYIMCAPLPNRLAETVAQAYERCVYRRFGASVEIRHDRDPVFMSEVFKAFNRLLNQRQRATLSYRPQANGQQERSVQTVVNTIKLYIEDPDQRDWDDIAERLMFALNTSYDFTRRETPFFLIHGWDPRATIEVNTPSVEQVNRSVAAVDWRRGIQQQYQLVREWAIELQKKLKIQRAENHNESIIESPKALDGKFFKPGDAVWLYIDKVKPGFKKNLAHLWHGPFRVKQIESEYSVSLVVQPLLTNGEPGQGYRFYPTVHVSRLKLVREYLERPTIRLGSIKDDDIIDFDDALLPEDSVETPLDY